MITMLLSFRTLVFTISFLLAVQVTSAQVEPGKPDDDKAKAIDRLKTVVVPMLEDFARDLDLLASKGYPGNVQARIKTIIDEYFGGDASVPIEVSYKQSQYSQEIRYNKSIYAYLLDLATRPNSAATIKWAIKDPNTVEFRNGIAQVEVTQLFTRRYTNGVIDSDVTDKMVNLEVRKNAQEEYDVYINGITVLRTKKR